MPPPRDRHHRRGRHRRHRRGRRAATAEADDAVLPIAASRRGSAAVAAGDRRRRGSGHRLTATTPTAPASSRTGSTEAGIESKCKTQPSTAAGGLFPKDAFDVDLDTDIVTCPNENRQDPAEQGRCRDRPVREGLPRLPAAGSVHQSRWRSHHQRSDVHERRLAEARARDRPTRTGPLTTEPPGPRWNASSRT